MGDSVERQRDYYARSAQSYDCHHLTPGDEHYVALEYTVGLARMFKCTSILDVGAGTGRSLRFLAERLPDSRVVGIEPVAELRERAEGDIRKGSGESLPFDDDAFDLVIATGVMHHLPDPAVVIKEMGRVASRLLLVSDSNRFGQGSPPSQLAKILLYKSGTWPLFEKVRTRGKGYMESEGDGVFYSYSIYDSLPQVTDWGTRAFVIPTRPQRNGFLGQFTAATHGLLVGIREPVGESGWAGH